MRTRSVLAIGGSAGGIEALLVLVTDLPADLPVPVLVTVHIGENAESHLPRILSRAGGLPAEHAVDGRPLQPGTIHVAPPGRHLLVSGGVARLSSGPRVNRCRPAADVMFASAARWAGEGCVAVVLSGMLDDGAVGAALVSRAGGRVLAQDPGEAAFDSMPGAALAAAPGARAVPIGRLGAEAASEIGSRLVGADGDDPRSNPDDHRPEVHMTMEDSADPEFLRADEARLTRLSCPDCGGVLAEADLPRITYYRCHVGHQYSPRTLEAAQAESVERTLWTAVAALEEHAALAHRLARAAGTAGDDADPVRDDPDGVEQFRHSAERSAHLAKSLRSRLVTPADSRLT